MSSGAAIPVISADPDGHLWEVAWNPEWELTSDGAVRLTYPLEEN
jgi:hypothetical protein